jgi:hypothetical protein
MPTLLSEYLPTHRGVRRADIEHYRDRLIQYGREVKSPAWLEIKNRASRSQMGASRSLTIARRLHRRGTSRHMCADSGLLLIVRLQVGEYVGTFLFMIFALGGTKYASLWLPSPLSLTLT